MKNYLKFCLGLCLIFLFVIGSLIAATITQPKLKVDLGKIDLGDIGGQGKITVSGEENSTVLYSWQRLLNPELLNNSAVRDQIRQMVEGYLFGSGSLERANELIAATLLQSGYQYQIQLEQKITFTAYYAPVEPPIRRASFQYFGKAEKIFGEEGRILTQNAGEGWWAYTGNRIQVGMIDKDGNVWGQPELFPFTDGLTFYGGNKRFDPSQNLLKQMQISRQTGFSGTGILTPILSGSGDFNPYDIEAIRQKVVPGRSAATNYTAQQETETLPAGKIYLDLNNQGFFDLELTGTGEYTECQVFANALITPLVLDMDGDGKLSASKGQWLPHPTSVDTKNLRFFDIDGTNFELITEWIGKGDGLLCEPKADGSVDGSCLFGSMGGFENGFDKLSLRDTNNSKILKGKELDGLFVWQDKNSNARAEKTELISLAKAGITQINLDHNNFVASFVRNGERHLLWDWFPNCLSVMKVAVRKME